ncbi:MAG: response regulator transcription factor [Thermodesulfobacteriota bacterium]
MSSYRIVLADDQTAICQRLKKIIGGSRDLKVVAEVGNGLELMELLPCLSAQMVIMDLTLPHLPGFEAIRRVKASDPDLKVLVLTSRREKEFLQLAFGMGADGCLLKEEALLELPAAIKTIRQGGIYLSLQLAQPLAELYIQNLRKTPQPPSPNPLTGREIEILTLIAEGKSSKEIASRLFLSFRTVQNHRANILRKLNLKKTADLVRYAIRRGYITITLG